MNISQVRVSFLGFGEAGFRLAKDLKRAGLKEIATYDKFWDTSLYKKVIQSRVKEAEVKLLPDVQKLAAESDFVLSTVTAASSKEIAKETAAFLRANQIYVDMNSSSPRSKRAVAQIISQSGAKFVDAALMGDIATHGHKIPILACGDGAVEFQSTMTKYGMNIRCIEGNPGDAAAIKMLRSIFMKGIESLLLETMIASDRYGALNFVLDSITKAIDEKPFRELINVLITTDAIHARRRASEMAEVVATLGELEVQPIMAEATKAKLEWAAGLGLAEHFNFQIPRSYTDVITAIKKSYKI